jgi:hypothetical protein
LSPSSLIPTNSKALYSTSEFRTLHATTASSTKQCALGQALCAAIIPTLALWQSARVRSGSPLTILYQYGYGDGSPFAKIVEARGRVLMIGAPLNTITLVHHAEHKANIRGKRIRRYKRLMPGAEEPEWIDFEEYETSNSVSETLPSDYFESIGLDYLASGQGQKGNVGASQSFLFDGPDFVRFAVNWLERSCRAGGN